MTNDHRISAVLLLVYAIAAAACSDGSNDDSSLPPAGMTVAGATATTPVAGASSATAGSPMAGSPMMASAGRAAPMMTPMMTPMTTPPMPAAGVSGGAAPMMPPTTPMGMMPDPMMPPDMGMTPNPMGGPSMSGGILPKVDSVDEDGPFESMSDPSGPHHVWRPAELGKDGIKHPIFVWGTGSGATPSSYEDFFPRFATHGFVVVAPKPAQLSATNMKAALDWIIAQAEDSSSPYYQKVDTTRIAMGGHSQGSVSTFNQEGMEDRLKTTIHIAGGSFDRRGSSKVKTPTAYICGETDFALPNCEGDWETVEDQPTFFSVLQGVDHIQCARRALPGMIAWLRWHLADETERVAQFTGPDGTFHMGIWDSQTKNWNF